MSEDELHKHYLKHCEPVFLLEQHLKTGHSELTPNATVTYVRLDGFVYAVTCQHVVQEMHERNARGERLSLAVAYSRSFTFFQNLDTRSAVYRTMFTSPATGEDISIAALGPQLPWGPEAKGKEPIDLDAWRAPDWSQVKFGAAVGFGTEHKRQLDDKVSAPMHVVIAELANSVRDETTQLVFWSELPDAHNTFLSGLSGGPVFVDDSGDGPKFAGIVFQGTPGGRQAWEERHRGESFVTEKDILIKAHLLTPDVFRAWLSACDFS